MIRRMAARSATSASAKAKAGLPRCWSRLAGRPVAKLSTTRTLRPRSSNASTTWLPAPALPGRVPTPLAADRQAGWAVYEWVEGRRLETGTTADLEAMLAFFAALLPLRSDPGTASLPLASEACLSLAELIQQNRR